MATLAAIVPRNAFFQIMEKTDNITANVSNLNATFHMDVSRKRLPLINIKLQVCIDLDSEFKGNCICGSVLKITHI